MLSKIIKENFQEYINQHFFIEIKPNWTVGSPLYHLCSSTTYSIGVSLNYIWHRSESSFTECLTCNSCDIIEAKFVFKALH